MNDENQEPREGDDRHHQLLREMWLVPPMQRPSFDDLVEKVASNHSEFVDFYASVDLDDEKAAQLGNALLCGGSGNTFLKDLNVRIGHHMTNVGAHALCAGIQTSQLEVLRLRGGQELSMEMAFNEDVFLSSVVGDGGEAGTGKEMDSILTLMALSDQHSRRSRNNTAFVAGQRSMRSDPTFIKNMHTIYLHGILGCETIQELSIDEVVGNMDHLVSVVPRLRQLNIANVDLSVAELEILSNGLWQARKLEVLCLSDCGMGVEHMQVLSAVIGNHPSINSVNLARNQIGDAGVASFVGNWHHDSPIRVLSLENNKIGRYGAQVLGPALRTHLSLCDLLVGANSGIGYEGIKLISDGLPGSKLSALGFRNNANWVKFEDVTCDAAVTQAFKRDEASKALLQGVRGSMYLESVLVIGLNLSPNVVTEIKLYLEANKRGRFLLLEQHKWPPSIWCHFLAKKWQNENLTFLFLRELPMLMANTNK